MDTRSAESAKPVNIFYPKNVRKKCKSRLIGYSPRKICQNIVYFKGMTGAEGAAKVLELG
jgi:hypothetical protein